MQMEFIAAVQIVVYVGGIVVLIIFSIFLTQQSGKEMPPTPMGRMLSSGSCSTVGFYSQLFAYQSCKSSIGRHAFQLECCNDWITYAWNRRWRICLAVRSGSAYFCWLQ
jgi:hypothetical protein